MDSPLLALQHIACEPPAAFEDELRARGHDLVRVELDEGEALPDWHDFAAIIVMGGPMGAYEDGAYPWLELEKRLLREAVDADLPVWGVCLGAQLLAAALGARVPLESERGYHVMLPAPGIALDVPSVVGDARFSITPMTGGIRLAGTIEFAGVDASPNPKRHDALVAHARRAFPGLRVEGQTRWMGHRPSLPDSLPVIGAARAPNVYYGFGHGHLGLTESATTGRLIGEMVAGEKTSVDMTPFRADRF